MHFNFNENMIITTEKKRGKYNFIINTTIGKCNYKIIGKSENSEDEALRLGKIELKYLQNNGIIQ